MVVSGCWRVTLPGVNRSIAPAVLQVPNKRPTDEFHASSQAHVEWMRLDSPIEEVVSFGYLRALRHGVHLPAP